MGLPCATKLRMLLSYDEVTGILRWKQRVNQGVHAGDIAGKLHKGHRYVRLKIGGQLYATHRLIWKMKTGRDPTSCLDHIDCNTQNNRWENLREATPSLNNCNRKLQRNNKSGVKGVTWNKADKRWKATIGVNCNRIYLGYFTNKDDAIKAVSSARSKYHGEFARAA